MILLDPHKIKQVILHCSASAWGSVGVFDQWHRDRGWAMIGYHWVITNCFTDYAAYKYKQPEPASDGLIHPGRSENFRGAHCADHNWESIGVCLVGKGGQFTSRQLMSAARLCTQIMDKYDYCNTVKGHYEFTNLKSCPDIDMDWFRKYILPLGREDA